MPKTTIIMCDEPGCTMSMEEGKGDWTGWTQRSDDILRRFCTYFCPRHSNPSPWEKVTGVVFMSVCPTCGAAVHRDYRDRHENWHKR